MSRQSQLHSSSVQFGVAPFEDDFLPLDFAECPYCHKSFTRSSLRDHTAVWNDFSTQLYLVNI